MSRFSRLFASGSSLRFASATVVAAMFAGLLMLPNTAAAQGLLQAPSANLTTGTVPQGVAAADFARTGWMGMVVTNSTGKNIKVFLGTGPNTYNTGTTYPTLCTDPTAVLATDINHDGYPDLVVACTSSATISVLINNGAGAFGTATTYALSGQPVALVAGDFVGNGYVDVASADSNGNVSVLLNTTGNGTFSASHVTLTGTLSGIAAGDFNKDGHLDLAVSDSANNTVHVLTNNGSGTFTQYGAYTTGAGTKPSSIVAADFNQDGNMDVATSNAGTNTATILLGNGTGVLTVQAAQATGTDPIALATTDVNSDGYPDLVAFDEFSTSTGAVAILLGNGNGTLQVAQTSSQAFLPGTQPAIADFNRDGKPDVAVVQQNANIASVLLNNTLPTQYPDGRSFAAYNPISNGYGNFADSVAAGDFNRDGNLDVAVSYLQDNDVQVLFGNGAGSFSSSATYPVGNQPYFIASGDLNGDGYPDLVVTNTNVNGATGTISVLLNNKNGTFASAATYTVGKQPYQVAIGDVNGDGYPDLAVTNYGANTVTILFGSANGTFTVQPTTLATCGDPYGVAIGDFKHNGFPSVAVTCYSTSQLEIFPNNGNGTFGTPYIYTVYDSYSSLTPNPESLVVGDFNRDGKLDIVVGNSNANNISFFAGNGDNTFVDSMESAPSLNHPASIAAGDFNGDGILDIVGVAPNYNAVDLTLGVGDGTFGTIAQRSAGEFTAKTQPWGLAVGDFNNDGQLDIVTANTFHQVALDSPTNQLRYMSEFPATPGGNPSVDVLLNASAAQINLTTSPGSPLPYNNSGVTINANVQPAYTGGTPTGSVIFENSSGAVLGTGPYTLNSSGTASYPVGHLGSGTYLFTSLYSGDANFQPTTGSGTAFAVTVNGTPVTLTISPASVGYGGTFTASVVVTGTAGEGVPTGTLTIYSSTGFTLGTVTLTASGNNSTGTANFTAVAPNLVPGTYNFYAVYTPTNGNYQTGSSSYAPLTVTTATTSTSIACSAGFLAINCTATVTNTVTGHAVPAGLTVDFTVNGGGATPETTNANGQATYSTGEIFGSFTVTATFPAQTYYQTSSASTTVLCFFICGGDRTGAGSPFNSLTLFGETNRSAPFRLF
ncbi:MAG TPA: FG-GAP-like repeat-containing protein [Acidobacteriaceae bacterium]|nr:FG-GAP-like repeat-containing protein [Acidobacteriaceae bacterium]